MIELGHLAIEVTRNCNMYCAHCLRGDPENAAASIDLLDRLFSQVSHVDVYKRQGFDTGKSTCGEGKTDFSGRFLLHPPYASRFFAEGFRPPGTRLRRNGIFGSEGQPEPLRRIPSPPCKEANAGKEDRKAREKEGKG